MKPENRYRYCKKCLLEEMTDMGKVFEDLRKYIDRIDQDLKVEEPVYRERLEKCRNCDQLISGMCRICGCYVELRAVMRKNACPKVHPIWGCTDEVKKG